MQTQRLAFVFFTLSAAFLLGSATLRAQISLSGYLQAEWQHYDQSSDPQERAFYSNSRKNLFLIRRGRIKFSHEDGPYSGALQLDMTERGVDIKDAYLGIEALDDDLLDVKIGLFNKPNYEVELSSRKREPTERSQIIRTLYPGERGLGVMLTSAPELAENFQPQIQLGVFNGNNLETSALKDIIARVSLPLPFGKDSDIKASIGGTFAIGGMIQPDDTVVTYENGDIMLTYDAVGSFSGWGNKTHAGVEAQVDAKLFSFGATKLRAEFLTGTLPTAAVRAPNVADSIDPVPIPTLNLRDISGYYVYLVQGLGKGYEAAFRYDAIDRNTGLAGTEVTNILDRASSVIGFGLLGTYGPVRITAWYEIPTFATDEARWVDGNGDIASTDLKDNKTTIRFQYVMK